MNLNKLYELAEKENIKVYDCSINNAYGIFVRINGINGIGLNRNLTYVHEKCVLAEELGHYYYDATYSPHCKNLQLILKQEHKAKKWAYHVLIPFENLKLAVKNGMDNIYDLSEYFDVSCPFMEECIYYYQNKGKFIKEVSKCY